MRNAPEYTDGVLEVFVEKEDELNDFPEKYLEKADLKPIWYRELSVFDRLRYSLGQQGKEVTLKVSIPQYKGIDSHCYCMIDEKMHRVYNAAHLISKEGFPETELTLIAPENNMRVKE